MPALFSSMPLPITFLYPRFHLWHHTARSSHEMETVAHVASNCEGWHQAVRLGIEHAKAQALHVASSCEDWHQAAGVDD